MPTEYRTRIRSRSFIAVVLTVIVVLAGCGGQKGPDRFEVSGAVTYEGKPVPMGFIVFNPDLAAGNLGPGAQADIHDGRYRTLPGNGTIGGPHVASVFGFDGKPYQVAKGPGGEAILDPMGHSLFKTATIKFDLPKQTTAQDIVVPKQ